MFVRFLAWSVVVVSKCVIKGKLFFLEKWNNDYEKQKNFRGITAAVPASKESDLRVIRVF